MNSTRPDPVRRTQLRTDLVCIDRAAQSDLMFWNLMGNGLIGQSDRPPTILIVEPGDGEGATVSEKRVREEIKEAVFRLTDFGLASVGFTGCDRNFIQFNHSVVQSGNWSILLDTATRNVVVLLASVACQAERGWIAVSPCRVAQEVVRTTPGMDAPDMRIVHMAQRLTTEIREAGMRGVPMTVELLKKDGCLPTGWDPDLGGELHVHHVSRWGAFPPIPVMFVDVSSKNRLD